MYCLKVSLCCIHWSPPSHFVKMGIKRETARGGGASGEGRILSRAPIFFFNNARNVSRVSRQFRIFWRLQNISGPSTVEKHEIRTDPTRIHTGSWRDIYVERRMWGKERRKDKEHTRRKFWEEKWVRKGKHQKLSPRDQGCSVISFCRDR